MGDGDYAKGPRGEVKEPRTNGLDLVGKISPGFHAGCGMCEWGLVFWTMTDARAQLHWHIKNTHGGRTIVEEPVGGALKFFS